MLCPSSVLSCYLVLPTQIPGPSSLPVPIPTLRIAPPLRLTPLLLPPFPPPITIRPYPTTAKTSTPLASEQTTNRGP